MHQISCVYIQINIVQIFGIINAGLGRKKHQKLLNGSVAPTNEIMTTLFYFQDDAEDGSRVACSGKTLQFFVCFISFFVVLRVRRC